MDALADSEADLDAGRFVSGEEVMRKLEASIARMEQPAAPDKPAEKTRDRTA